MQYDVSVHMTVNLAANLVWQLDSCSFNFKVSHIHRANQVWEDSPSYQLPFSCDKGRKPTAASCPSGQTTTQLLSPLLEGTMKLPNYTGMQ